MVVVPRIEEVSGSGRRGGRHVWDYSVRES